MSNQHQCPSGDRRAVPEAECSITLNCLLKQKNPDQYTNKAESQSPKASHIILVRYLADLAYSLVVCPILLLDASLSLCLIRRHMLLKPKQPSLGVIALSLHIQQLGGF